MATQSLKFKVRVHAPASEMYRAFTNSTALRDWFCNAAQADPRKGGRIYLWWNNGYYASGEFTALVPNRRVTFTWHGRGEPGATRVQVVIAEKDDGAIATISHQGIGSGKAWAKASKEIEQGWRGSLENLQAVLETGLDLRFVRRPMLGINVSFFGAEEAAKLGVPVAQGVRLDGVVDGMGAQKAGLRKDDVIVQMGKTKVTGFASFARALQGRRAGDKIPVVFYRGGEKKTVTMELSGRKLPTVPPTARELANAVRRLYDALNAELDELLKGTTEPEASYQPAPNEWNVKETLAHLIAGERANHFALYDFIYDSERAYDHFDNLDNLPAQTDALVQAYGTTAELVKEFKRNQAETIAMLAALPEKFVEHKGTYWRVAVPLLQTDDHTRGHLQQMRAAIEAARKK